MNLVVLGSGRGSNAGALLRAHAAGELGAAVPVALISDRGDAPILRLGEPYGVPGHHLDPGRYKTKLEGEGEARYIDFVGGLEPGLIVLAGFMRVLKPLFLEAFAGKVINLHPSLLPSFKGLDGIGQAFRAGVKVTGCTVHWVSAEIDAGAIIDQEAVRLDEGETLASLEAKVHAAEHRLLPRTVAMLSLAAGRDRIPGS